MCSSLDSVKGVDNRFLAVVTLEAMQEYTRITGAGPFNGVLAQGLLFQFFKRAAEKCALELSEYISFNLRTFKRK